MDQAAVETTTNGATRAKYKPRGKAFTPEAAREAAQKAAAARKANAKQREEIARQVALTPQKLALERAELCASEIARTHKTLMEEELTAKDRAGLLTALSRLLDQERVLRGIPNPGSYRPTKPRGSESPSDAEPV